MEEHLNDKNRLSKEWDLLSNYVAEPNNTLVASNEENMNKNRYSNILPCMIDYIAYYLMNIFLNYFLSFFKMIIIGLN
jgi:hypothetical protein